jgi:hypothetical protein
MQLKRGCKIIQMAATNSVSTKLAGLIVTNFLMKDLDCAGKWLAVKIKDLSFQMPNLTGWEPRLPSG